MAGHRDSTGPIRDEGVRTAETRPYSRPNRENRERLGRIVGRLTDQELAREIREDWTVADALLHIGFWDRFVLERWKHANSTGNATPVPIEDHVVDLVNDSLHELLADVPVGRAARHALEASAAIDGLIDTLPSDSLDGILAEGRLVLLDRSLHRGPHLDEIEAALRDAMPEGPAQSPKARQT